LNNLTVTHSQTNLLLYVQHTGIVITIMSGRKPFWKPYEIPEECKSCPYIAGLEQRIQDKTALAYHSTEVGLEMSGIQWELRGRKRRAQHCVGPVVVNDTVTLCETVGSYVDEAGQAIKDRLDAKTSRLFNEATIEDFLPSEEPPEED